MRAELKRAADLVAFQRREALSRKRLSGDPRNPFRPRYGAELTFAAASQEAETLAIFSNCLRKKRPESVQGGSSPRWTRSSTSSSAWASWPSGAWGSPPRVSWQERRTASPVRRRCWDWGLWQRSTCTGRSGSKSKNDYTGRRTAVKSNGKLCPLGKLVVKALTDQDKTKTQLAAEIGTSPQYLSYILYGVRSGEKYLPAIIAALNLDPRKVEKVTAA